MVLALVTGLIFAWWGYVWSSLTGTVVLLVANSSLAFIIQHWPKLGGFPASDSFDASADRASNAVTGQGHRNTDGLFVFYINLVGVLGIIIAAVYLDADSGDDWFSLIITWGGHAQILIAAIALGMVTSIVGFIAYRLSGRQKGWWEQLSAAGIWMTLAASAVPIGMIAIFLAILVFFIWWFLS